MATISKYQTATGATLYRVRYRTPGRGQTDKRGFKTKRDAQAFAEQIEVDKRRGLYVAPSDGRVKFGDLARVARLQAQPEAVDPCPLRKHSDGAVGGLS
jgi:hypothetical protein